jgi:hypothetical protein
VTERYVRQGLLPPAAERLVEVAGACRPCAARSARPHHEVPACGATERPPGCRSRPGPPSRADCATAPGARLSGPGRDLRRESRMWASAHRPAPVCAKILPTKLGRVSRWSRRMKAKDFAMKWSSARKDFLSARVAWIPRPWTRRKAGYFAPPQSPSDLPRCRPASTVTLQLVSLERGPKASSPSLRPSGSFSTS